MTKIWKTTIPLVAVCVLAAATSPVSTLVSTINSGVDEQRALDTVRRVYSTDRWFTFPKFEQTALYLKQRLQESGLIDVEIDGAKADGVTQSGYWTMPLAWDAKQATLDLIEPEHTRLCDYEVVPASLGMWSGPTPPGGVTAELVDITRTPWPEVKGKLVLTDKNAAVYKSQLVKYGAIGAVNGFSENPSLQDGRQWVNAWGDNGWAFIKTSTPLLSFSITPRQTAHLRSLLAAGKTLKVHAVVDTRYYQGRYPWVTGVLPGIMREEEVLVLGHTSEQGAQDNATGVSAMIEAVHTISDLVANGKLARPQRSVRILLMPELYGAMTYIAAHPERMAKAAAAMTVDTPAAPHDLAGTEYTFYVSPHAGMSYADALVLRIAQAYFPETRPWHWHEFMPGTDSYLGEPSINVPDVWPYSGTGIVTHHNSEDTPDKVDAHSMHDLIAMIASYLYFNAAAGERDAKWLADIGADRSYDYIRTAASAGIDGILAGDEKAGSFALDRVSYFSERGESVVRSVLRLVPVDRREAVQNSLAPVFTEIRAFRDLQLARLRDAGAHVAVRKPAPDLEKIIVKRKRIGTLPLDDLPQAEWEGYPSGAWDTLPTIALYWCDGHRNLGEVKHLTEMELGPSDFDFAGYFRFLERHGYVEFVR